MMRRNLVTRRFILLLFVCVGLNVVTYFWYTSSEDNVRRVPIKIRPPGVVLQVRGGIGNQLWQYACSYGLAKRKNWPLYINQRGNPSNRRFKVGQREFALDQFNTKLNHIIVDPYFAEFPDGKPVPVTDEQLFHKTIVDDTKLYLHTGQCQSELYWKEYEHEIKSMYQPRLDTLNTSRTQNLIQQIWETESVSVHVRRGDFLQHPELHIPISYHRRAILLMIQILREIRGVKYPTFFVFSDDIRHTQKKLKDFTQKYNFVFVSLWNTTSIEDFYLMMNCKYNIVPNSTFSWWVAYLNANKDKIVIASALNPKYWTDWKSKRKGLKIPMYGQMIKEWIIIDPFSGGLPFPNPYINKTVF